MQIIQEPTELEAILNLLEALPAGPQNRKIYLTVRERSVFIVVYAFLLLSMVIAGLAKISLLPRTSAEIASLVSLGLGELGLWANGAWIIWSDFQEVNKPVPKARSRAIQLDYLRLSQMYDFPSEKLRFLSRRLQLEAEHLRSRVGTVFGSIDKVGFIPMAVGTIYTGWKLMNETHIQTSFATVGLAVLSLLYLRAMALTRQSHRVDECAQMLELAALKINESCVGQDS